MPSHVESDSAETRRDLCDESSHERLSTVDMTRRHLSGDEFFPERVDAAAGHFAEDGV